MSEKLFTVKIDMSDAAKILENHGLEKGGRVQAFFTTDIMRRADKYVPMNSAKSFSFSANPQKVHPEEGYEAIIYDLDYGRVHWYGKLMVDPVTKKGAFFNPERGFWSRKHVKKELSDRDMQYQGAPLRGPKWVERSWLDNKDDIIRSTEEFARKIK